MSKNQIWVVAGASLMAFGTLLPVISIPLAGSLNYFQNGQGDGVFVIVLAAVTAAMAFTRALRYSWIPASLGGALILYSLLNLIATVSNSLAELERSLEGNPFAGLAQGLVGSVQIQWGWGVMLGGVAAVVVGSFWRKEVPETKNKETEENQ